MNRLEAKIMTINANIKFATLLHHEIIKILTPYIKQNIPIMKTTYTLLSPINQSIFKIHKLKNLIPESYNKNLNIDFSFYFWDAEKLLLNWNIHTSYKTGLVDQLTNPHYELYKTTILVAKLNKNKTIKKLLPITDHNTKEQLTKIKKHIKPWTLLTPHNQSPFNP